MLRLAIALALFALPAPAQTRAEVMDHVFVTAQRAAVTAASRALAQSATRIAAGDPALAALLRVQQDDGARLRGLLDALARAAEGTGAGAEALQADLARQIAALRVRLGDLDTRLAAEFPAFRDLTDPAPLSVAEVQAVLDPDEALLFTLTDHIATYVWAITPTAAAWHRSDTPRDDRVAQVTALRRQLSGGLGARAGVALGPGTAPRGQPFDRATGHAIYADLFAPLEPVFGAARHVMAVLDGPLTSLPPALLVRRPPDGDDADPAALRATDWMVAAHALTTLPNVSALKVLRFARGRAAGDARQPFAGFGDPLLGYRLAGGGDADAAPGVISRGVYDDVTRVADLAPLPQTAPELRRLAAILGGGEETLFLGARATEARVKAADLSATRIVAFATHGLLADGLPGLTEPALVFTPPAVPDATDDALLTASEAAQLTLSADLVILSACDTAGSDGRPGAEGLSGLARAFLYAGARAILVSHWPVDDAAASALTTAMLEKMSGDDPRPRAQALQAAMLALLHDPAQARFAHPRLWAPFVVVGEGGRDG